MINNRRKFIKNAITLSAVTSISPRLLSSNITTPVDTKSVKPLTFLFQGDSITDGNRTRDNDWNHVLGHGYQFIIASKMWYEFPQRDLHFFNRGVSGNKLTELAARWQKDTIEIKPDVLSILVGINDVSEFISGDNNFSAEQYENSYKALLQLTKQQLPQIQFVLCEPFILPVGSVKGKWQQYETEVKKRQAIVKKLSNEWNAIFVPFQTAFNRALAKAPAEYWIWDGIHPMPAGHQLMAIEWMTQVGKTIKFVNKAV